MPLPKKIEARLQAGLKRFQPILASAKARDINEADTVTLVADLLAEIWGYDKYSEVTQEFAIRSTFCDLAIKIDGKLELLIEVKATGLELKDGHVKQAVDYAANQGVDWVALTNGHLWRIYRVTFGKPIDHELVLEFDLVALSPRTTAHLELLSLVSREAIVRSALPDYHARRQATSRFLLGAIILSDPVLEIIRRELRRISADVRIDLEEIRGALTAEVLKRDVVEGEAALSARKKVLKAVGKSLRTGGGKSIAISEPSEGDALEAEPGADEPPTSELA